MRRPSTQVVFALLLACGPPAMHSLDQSAIEQQRLSASRGTNPPAIDTRERCQSGSVASDGPLGGPIEHARVRVIIDEEQAYEVETDRVGAFKVCLGKRKNGTIRLEIEHPGYEPGAASFVFEQGGPPHAIILRKSRT